MIDRLAITDALLASPADAIIATDREGVVAFWSPGAERLFGFSEEETLGRAMDMIVPEALREGHWTGYRRVIETGVSRYGDGDLLAVPALTKDGRRISVEFTIAMLRDDQGCATGMVAILRDVTARFEKTRQLERALEVLGKEVSADA